MLLRQLLQSIAEIAAAVVADLAAVVIADANIFTRRHPPGTQVIQGYVAGDSHNPSGEGHVSRFVLPDHGDQLHKNVLRYVFCLVMILDQAPNVAVDIFCVADIEEVQALLITSLSSGDRRPDDQAVAMLNLRRSSGLG